MAADEDRNGQWQPFPLAALVSGPCQVHAETLSLARRLDFKHLSGQISGEYLTLSGKNRANSASQTMKQASERQFDRLSTDLGGHPGKAVSKTKITRKCKILPHLGNSVAFSLTSQRG
jgi:hypothetical protein